MPHEDEDIGSAADWLRHARSDLAFARVPVPQYGIRDQLCFFAQQAVEKSIKAVLVATGVRFRYTHDLQALVNLIPERVSRGPEIGAATRLTVYAISPRYPGIGEPVTDEDYEQAVRLAEAVFKWAEDYISATK
jgi:HEPN domain-containing protein